ncbi:hypothetical protein COCVIDRAFT_103048 [Bipolaris victoriae FI3]|uniref:Uncharacterized protein n=1 Tax=Bipolaris victoriae (strain FI3) TaxID=930091 RepID=W7EBS3_BIPV3|nr:hypothetical protein COCVIDRAFT_103048 [Bipolaris victoriae FI3]
MQRAYGGRRRDNSGVLSEQCEPQFSLVHILISSPRGCPSQEKPGFSLYGSYRHGSIENHTNSRPCFLVPRFPILIDMGCQDGPSNVDVRGSGLDTGAML